MPLLPTPESELAPLGFLTAELLDHEIYRPLIPGGERIVDTAVNASSLIVPSLVVIERVSSNVQSSQYELAYDKEGRLSQVKSRYSSANFPDARLTIQERIWSNDGRSYTDTFPESDRPDSRLSFLDNGRVEIEENRKLITIEERAQEDGGRVVESVIATKGAGTERYITAYDQTGKPLQETHEQPDDLEFGHGPSTTKVWSYDPSGEIETVSIYGRRSYVNGEARRAPDIVYQVSKNKSGNYKITKTMPVYQGLLLRVEDRKYDINKRPYEIKVRGLLGHDNDRQVKLHYD